MNVSSNTTSIQFLQEVSVGHFVKSFVEIQYYDILLIFIV